MYITDIYITNRNTLESVANSINLSLVQYCVDNDRIDDSVISHI